MKETLIRRSEGAHKTLCCPNDLRIAILLLADPRISEMLEGMQHFSKRKKEILMDYQLLRFGEVSGDRWLFPSRLAWE